MIKNTIKTRIEATPETMGALEIIVREGACKMLQAALEAEIEEHISRFKDLVDDDGKRLVVRNGTMPERTVLTGAGPLPITRPRVDDRKLESLGKERFTSRILPPFMRRAPSIDTLVPVLYLKGISTDDFPTALEAILGPQAKGLSASTVVRLKEIWTEEYGDWSKRDLSGKRYVYIWADGVYCNARLEDERSCLLVVMGADSFGNKELLAVHDGYRESTQSWKEILLDLRSRGLAKAPALAVCDGAMGFQAACAEVWPETRIQRCWFHKSGNVLDKLPKALQSKAKDMLHDQYLATTREDALKAFALFVESFGAKYPKAVECLVKDKDDLFAFYDFPAMHWIHLRTTNPIESTFATVRLRHRRTKGNGTRKATLAMVYKLCREAEQGWRKLDGYKFIPLVEAGVKFVNGEQVDGTAA
ncbi:MAG TPA: IS256 family transposase [Aminobacteriaceae bacterium]|nr:IS256 family transposase [Aminobacteriaceae bacterium]